MSLRKVTNYISYILFLTSLLMISCKKDKNNFDASGIFEADEVIIAAEVNGKMMTSLSEGEEVKKGELAASLDDATLILQKQQLTSSIEALYDKRSSSGPQGDLLKKQQYAQSKNLAVIKEQIVYAEREKLRIKNLLVKEAVPTKQLDDIEAQLSILIKQEASAQEQVNTFDQQMKTLQQSVNLQNKSILSEKKPLEAKIASIDDQIKRCKITSPIDGNVLVKYIEDGEIVTMGKPIMKIAKLNEMIVRAYITGNQLAEIILNQAVSVYIGNGEKQKKYAGQIVWISSKAEFTPRTIQTADERENLVYAIKVKVVNNGYVKLGMYADISFK